jgi:hypothetical protein
MMERKYIVQAVHSFVGLSAKHDPNGDLARLVDFPGGAPPEQEVLIKTNCAMFACGVLRWLGEISGFVHPLLMHEYVNGWALTWLLEIAHDMKASHYPHDGYILQPGDILHWATPPKPGVKPCNDDHVAFSMTVPDIHRRIIRAGGGAADNEITESREAEDYTIDHRRPVRHILCVPRMLGLEPELD